MPRDIGVDPLGRPVLQLGLEFGLRHGDALGAVDLGEAAGQHRLGLVIERAQQLRLPAVPDAGPDRADVGGGEDGQQLHALERLHHRGEILDGLAVGQVARLRHGRHDEVLLDQPGDGVGVGGRQAEARAEGARDPGAGDRVVLDPALGDVVQEQRDVEQRAVLGQDLLHQIVGEREFIGAAALDVGEHADAAQQMLVHRVVVVHVELHHRDDAAERAHEAAEHAGFVHPPQHDLGVVRGQDFEEQPVGLGIVPQLRVDQPERLVGEPHRVRVQHQVVLLRETEHPDQVDRIAREHVLVGNGDAIVVVDEILALRQRRVGRAGRNFAIIRLSTGAGLACWSSSSAHRIAVRSPTSLAIRK